MISEKEEAEMGMDMDKIVERAKRNIWQAIEDYKDRKSTRLNSSH